MKLNRLILIVLLVGQSITSHLWAQPGGPNEGFVPKPMEVSAVVVDSFSNQALEFVDARIYTAQDTTLLSGMITDSSGGFVFSKVKPGAYLIRVKFVGYQTKWIGPLNFDGATKDVVLGRIGLVPQNFQDLEEARVVGRKDIFSTSIDKRSYDVSADLNNQGASAEEVLGNVPSIEVDQDGNVSLRGDANVIILIDGRPSSLTGSGESMLDALPADAIERIEVVTNPSAKYDPDGTSGIINIVLKKNKLKGVNGLISSTVATGPNFNPSASLSLRNKRLNVFGAYAFNHRQGFRNFSSDLTQTFADGSTQTLSQNRDGLHFRDNQNIRGGLDFYVEERKTIGFSVNHRISEQTRTGDLNNVLLDGGSDTIRRSIRSAVDPSNNKALDFAIYFKQDLKDNKGTWTFDASHSSSKEDRYGYYNEKFFVENYQPLQKNVLSQRLENNLINQVYTAQTDYLRLFEATSAKIELGAKVILRFQDQSTFSEQFDRMDNQWVADTFATFDYAYQERVYSTYAIYGRQFKRWKAQVGVRGELAQQIPFLKTTGERIENRYLNLFPSGHLRYDLKKDRELSLSYSRRINRARSSQLNPFTNYSDPNNLRSGNPYLQPEYIDSYDFSWIKTGKKGSVTAAMFYRKTNDVIQRIKVFYDNNTSAVTYQNIDESESVGLEFIWQFKPNKKWRGNLSMNGNRIAYDDNNETLDFRNTGFNYGLKGTVTHFFWKNTASVQVNGRYNSPRVTAQGMVLPRASMDLSANKKLKNRNWSIGMRFSDVFNTRGFIYDLSQGPNRQTGEYKWQSRRLYLTVAYKFGKLEMTKDRSGFGGEGGGFDF